MIAGEEKGYPIVLLHGWPQTWYEWRHIIPELVERLREFGKTTNWIRQKNYRRGYISVSKEGRLR